MRMRRPEGTSYGFEADFQCANATFRREALGKWLRKHQGRWGVGQVLRPHRTQDLTPVS